MAGEEEKQSSTREIRINDSFQPFLLINEDENGNFETSIWRLSSIGEVKLYASTHLGQPDNKEGVGELKTEKFFEDPRRIWAELIPNTATAQQLERLSRELVLYYDLNINNSVVIKPRIKDSKLIFDVSSPDKSDKNIRSQDIRNPLLEDKKFVATSFFTFMKQI
mgnify:CR=1 FL=1